MTCGNSVSAISVEQRRVRVSKKPAKRTRISAKKSVKVLFKTRDEFMSASKQAATTGCEGTGMTKDQVMNYVNDALHKADLYWFIHREEIPGWEDKKRDVLEAISITEDAKVPMPSLKIMLYFTDKYGEERGFKLNKLVQNKLGF